MKDFIKHKQTIRDKNITKPMIRRYSREIYNII